MQLQAKSTIKAAGQARPVPVRATVVSRPVRRSRVQVCNAVHLDFNTKGELHATDYFMGHHGIMGSF